MSSREPADVLREAEEGSRAFAVDIIAKAEQDKHEPSQYHEPARVVRSGLQTSSPAPSLTRKTKIEPEGSGVSRRGQAGLPPRQTHSRPPSCATEKGIANVTPGKKPPPDKIHRVSTGPREPLYSKQASSEKIGRTWHIPYKKTDSDNDEDDLGDVELDVGKPGPWVVDHHLHGLVLELVPPPAEVFQQRVIGWYRDMRGKSHQPKRLDGDNNPERTFRVSFAEMQRMHLRKLQVGLVKHAVTMYNTRAETVNWEKDLAAYTQAMKDYDYMMECSKRPRDYFLVTGERGTDHYITRRVVKDVLNRYNKFELDKPREEYPLGPWEYGSQPIGGTRNRTLKAVSFKDFRDRLFLATVGAALLLGPMWLMVLHKTLYTGLITTTVCVAVFGLVVVFRLDKPMDVLSATAAYAAVLVVFVGLTIDSS